MKKLKRKIDTLIGRIMDRVMLGGQPSGGGGEEDAVEVSPGARAILRRAAAESIVLLENDGVLPLRKDARVAVFGRTQIDWFFGGLGSGGDVRTPYAVNLADALAERGAQIDLPTAEAYRAWTSLPENRPVKGFWGRWNCANEEMPCSEADVRAAAERCACALAVIGRTEGEDRDLAVKKGSYLLSDGERAMLDCVTAHFEKTVLILNTGSVIDLSFLDAYRGRIAAALLCWFGGMEAGNAVCDVLYGDVNPCGRLPDTAAVSARDWPGMEVFHRGRFTEYTEGVFVGYRYFDAFAPGRVRYPFGRGMSYTSFQTEPLGQRCEEGGPVFTLRVKNVGERRGKHAVLLFAELPDRGRKTVKRALAAFGKTKELAPGEEEILSLPVDRKTLARYDERESAFFTDGGEYRFTVEGKEVGRIYQADDEAIERCASLPKNGAELKKRILSELPAQLPAQAGKYLRYSDLVEGRATVEEMIAQMSPEELEGLTRGHGMMNSPYGARGNAGVCGGVTEELRARGVPAVSLCDGPSGLRMAGRSLLLPCGTALAATFDADLVEEVYGLVADEMKRLKADVLLGPGMNVHRNPLCGRNFEYFSEDPLLTGKIAAAAVRGIQKNGGGACPKHFACNNRERGRKVHDARLSERAMREIYLRGFEICIKESGPVFLMSSYNKVNGVWMHYHYALITGVLRGEWGFRGAVMTDWWPKKAKSPIFRGMKNNACRVRAQADLLMPGDWGFFARSYRSDRSLLPSLKKKDGLTAGELQRSAGNVLSAILRVKKAD